MELCSDIIELAGVLGDAAEHLKSALFICHCPSCTHSPTTLNLDSLAILFHFATLVHPIVHALKAAIEMNALEPPALCLVKIVRLLSVANFCEALYTALERNIEKLIDENKTDQENKEEIMALLVKSISLTTTGVAIYCQEVAQQMPREYYLSVTHSCEHCMRIPLLQGLLRAFSDVLSASGEGKFDQLLCSESLSDSFFVCINRTPQESQKTFLKMGNYSHFLILLIILDVRLYIHSTPKVINKL